MKQVKSLFFCISNMTLALLLCACDAKTPAETSSASTPAQAAEAVYSVGMDASYAPFEYLNNKHEVQGFDVDVLTAVAEKEGLKLRFVNTPWEGIFASLAQGDRDILASAITITDERKQSVDFSDPYFEARQLIAIPAGEKGIRNFHDLKSRRVAVQSGTTGDEVVQKLKGRTSPDIKRFESMPLALKELESGGVDAVVGDNGVVTNYVENNPGSGIAMIEDAGSFAPEYYGFAVRKGNAVLLARLNAGLAAIRADGRYEAIYKKYLGAAR
jgi:polar amino acid transport system substrate-binding protein